MRTKEIKRGQRRLRKREKIERQARMSVGEGKRGSDEKRTFRLRRRFEVAVVEPVVL